MAKPSMTPEQFEQAARAEMAQAREEVRKLKALPAPREPYGTLETYDRAMAALGLAMNRASVCFNAHPDRAMREAAEKAEQELAALGTELSLDRGIYDVLASLDQDQLDAGSRHWLKRTLDGFRRSGVDRDEPTRQKVRALNAELVKIGQEFGKNIIEDVRHVELEPGALEGLPDDFRRSHPVGANGKVSISTEATDYVPFMKYAKSSAAREKLWREYMRRAAAKNVAVLEEMLEKRHALATLLGYRSWAHLDAENKMIGDERSIARFIERVAGLARERSKRDYQDLVARKRKDEPGVTEVFPWETAYLSNRIEAERFGFDSQAARAYFEYARVKQGVLDVTGRLFGVSYRATDDADVWHPEVEAYDVLDVAATGKVLGRIYLDMHPREGKYKHYAQFTLVDGKQGARLPEGVLLCNFSKPGETPALLEHDQVSTFFHEFGHLLHHVLGGHTRWSSTSGVATEWDFVEVPSQLLEEWTWEPDVLATFARHHQTDEPIPSALVKKMKAADEFGKGLHVMRQMFLAAVSLTYYVTKPEGLDTTREMARLYEEYLPYRYQMGDQFQAAFGHLNGYAANYYTYMWSLVMAKDLAEQFRKQGFMNPELGRRYRQSILEPGGLRPAAELMKDFLGRPYGFEAFERWLNDNA